MFSIFSRIGLSALGFGMPWRLWLFGGIATLVSFFVWHYFSLKKTVRNYNAAIEVRQNTVDGNRELVEQLSRDDDEIMYSQQQRAEEAGKRAKSWLRQQNPQSLTSGYVPKGYAKTINEVE